MWIKMSSVLENFFYIKRISSITKTQVSHNGPKKTIHNDKPRPPWWRSADDVGAARRGWHGSERPPPTALRWKYDWTHRSSPNLPSAPDLFRRYFHQITVYCLNLYRIRYYKRNWSCKVVFWSALAFQPSPTDFRLASFHVQSVYY